MTLSIQTRCAGFTIIEIMIALLLSVLLLAGVGQVYLSSKQSYRTAENVARLQESSRFAMDILSKELRMAGFSPCPPTSEVAVTLGAGLPAGAINFGQGAIVGYEGGVSAFPADFPAEGTSPGDRVAGTDALMILRGSDTTYTVESHNPSAAEFKVIDPTGLGDGDILMVCDAHNTAIFQTSNVTVGSGSVVHNTGVAGIWPGNCTKGLGYPVVCTALGTPYAYDTDAQIVKFISNIYYIGVSQSGTSRSLYRRPLLTNTGGTVGAAAAQELIDGIENMQLLFGLDVNGDRQAERYVAADQVTAAGSCGGTACTWNDVVGVRVGLLTHTPDEITGEDDTREYNVAGTVLDDTSHGNDGRIRNVFTSTIKIRNRGML
jgi:type IV pilus assembly protein PilW